MIKRRVACLTAILTASTVVIAWTGAVMSPLGLKGGFVSWTVDYYLDQDENEIDIAECLLLIDSKFYPPQSLTKFAHRVEMIAREVGARLRGVQTPDETVKTINKYLFEELSFTTGGPDNYLSFHTVLEHGIGNCLCLTALYLSITDRLGLPFYTVSIPGHIFIRYDDGECVFNIETTAGGRHLPDEFYIYDYSVAPEAIRQGTYMRNLSKKEFLANVLFTMTDLNRSRSKPGETLKEYDKIIALNPFCIGAHQARAWHFLKTRRLLQAVDTVTEILHMDPRNTYAYAFRGCIFNMCGDHKAAVNDLRKATVLDPTEEKWYYTLADSYKALGKFDKAIENLDQALSLNPAYVDALLNRGSAYFKKGEPDKALRDFNMVLEIQPNNPRAKKYKNIARQRTAL